MGIFDFGGDGSDHHFECRNCGQNVSAEFEQCPECGGDVVDFDLT